jgi:demethylmenaquinone methyltransferase / 2-methoxy-6-polyprenyl-1,4-benzoquinol methylase
MANKFYQPGEQRGARVEDLFATVAPHYDRINDLQSFWMHRLWKRRLLRLTEVKAGDKALDVCCGTGDIARAIARSGADATGLDFSKAMLKVAAERNLKSHIANLRFIAGDAQQLPFDDNSFDIVTIGYGLRNLSSCERGLEEMYRVARPGGRLLVLDFAKPDNVLWRKLYFSYLKYFVPMFGKLFCGDAATHAYIYESLLAYPAQHGVARKMKDLGGKDVRIVTLLGGAMSINFGRK